MRYFPREAVQVCSLYRPSASTEPAKVGSVSLVRSWLATKFSFCHIDRETLLHLATEADLRRPAAIRAIDRVLSEAGGLRSRLAHYPVGNPTIEQIDSAVRESCGLLASRSEGLR